MKKYYSIREEHSDGNYTYSFITDSNILYSIEFDLSVYDEYLEQFPLLLNNGYAFSIFSHETAIGTKRKYDEGVRNTIFMIVNKQYTYCGDDTILLFHCDHADNKQRHRSIVFNTWYREADQANEYIKESLEIEVNQDPVQKHYLGYITKRTNSQIVQLEEEFDRFSYFMIGAKSV